MKDTGWDFNDRAACWARTLEDRKITLTMTVESDGVGDGPAAPYWARINGIDVSEQLHDNIKDAFMEAEEAARGSLSDLLDRLISQGWDR